MSLHRSLSLFVLGSAGLALIAAVCLILLTSYLHRTTVELEAGLHSVRLAEELQFDLLMYTRTQDPLSRAKLESDLQNKVVELEQYVSDPNEARILANAGNLIEDLLLRREHGPAQDERTLEHAFLALSQLVDLNVAQSEASLHRSAQWDQLGDRVGWAVSLMLCGGMALMLVWLRLVAFSPVFDIRNAIRDFAAGGKTARIPERGPEELRSIAAQFNAMATAVERQYENQLTFIAAVAHDLRNPVSAMRMSADILSSDHTLSADRVSSLMSIISRQVQRLDRMVGDLLDASTIEAGHLELHFEDSDARTVARDVYDLFLSAFTTHKLTLQLPDQPVMVRCDPLRIEQVLNNLLSNAVKYSPKGTTIDFSLEEMNGAACFRVSDHGFGIPEEELPYIFEPFRRARSPDDKVPGVGLGLSVARRIVEAHGGGLRVESRLGKGTTFRVLLKQASPTIALERAP